MSTIVISADGLGEVVARFGALPRKIESAKRRAINKVAKGVKSAAGKEIAGVVGVAQKVIKARIASRAAAGGREGLVWFGLNPLSVTQSRFGNLRQAKTGARAGKLAFDGAFVASMPSGHRAVFRRYGKARLPIRTETLPLATPATQAIINAQAAKARERLAEVFAQELNYEVNVKGAR